jgi:multiple sugar transport system permease protein
MKNFKKKLYKFFYFNVPLFIISLFVFFPLLWTIITAIKREKDIMQRPISYLPNPITIENFITSWNVIGFSTYFKNSLIVSFSVVIIVIIFSTMAGYSITRFKFKGSRIFLLLLLSTQFLPGALLLIPMFEIFNALNLLDNLMALMITYTAFQLPLNIMLMIGFLSKVPIELEEAAMIDGCSQIQAIFKVVLPVIKPGMVAAGSFAFIGAWKEFLFALMLMNSPSNFTLPVGLSYMLGQFSVNYGALAAGALIAVLPAFLIFAYIQKFLVYGLAGAVKG